MTLPFSLGMIPLPDWIPGWLPVALLIPVVLWLLLLLVMPFAVLGTRSRLEGIEAQLDDLHGELRSLAMQLGSPMAGPPPARRDSTANADRVVGGPEPERGQGSRPPGPIRPGSRAEPRISWPRAVDD